MPNDSDDIEYAKERAAALGVQVFENGNPPESTALRRLFALAIRESVTNCVPALFLYSFQGESESFSGLQQS